MSPILWVDRWQISVDDELGVCPLSLAGMGALRPKDAISARVSEVTLRCISDSLLEKPTSTRGEGDDDDDIASALAQAGGDILCRNASDYAHIGGCRTAEAVSAVSASRPSLRDERI
jgi:hypothetical protein